MIQNYVIKVICILFYFMFYNMINVKLYIITNVSSSYQLICISQTVCNIYVVELKHDSTQNNIREASCRDASFSLNDRCCICMKSFFYL